MAYSALGPAAAGFYIVGGTRAGSPQWAGILALAKAGRALKSKGPIGFPNPGLFAIAQGAHYYILTGSTVGFSAGPGYDLVPPA